jgi:hypothetical protein
MMKTKTITLRNLIPVIFTGLLLSSCSKDSNTTPADDLAGTWTAQSSAFTGTVNGKPLTQYYIDSLGFTSDEAQQAAIMFNSIMQQSFTGTIQFKSDNTYVDNMGGETDTGTWSLSPDNKKLTISPSSGTPTTLDVIELTSSKLHLTGTETEYEDLNGDSAPDTIVISIDLTLTK